MKLRYIILGVSIFFWSALIASLLSDHLDVAEIVLGYPLQTIVILAAGVLIGIGIAHRSG